MPVEVILPRVDMDMATGKISKWFVKEGETVTKGAPIFEIETDKAAMEVESPGDGVIRNITAGEGIDIPVGTPSSMARARRSQLRRRRNSPSRRKRRRFARTS
jgi:pyruvate dehydrogenase E2 component (dihydrolipoamide acetyltransferase)